MDWDELTAYVENTCSDFGNGLETIRTEMLDKIESVKNHELLRAVQNLSVRLERIEKSLEDKTLDDVGQDKPL